MKRIKGPEDLREGTLIRRVWDHVASVGPVSMRDIAEALAAQRSVVSGALNRLQQLGLVALEGDQWKLP